MSSSRSRRWHRIVGAAAAVAVAMTLTSCDSSAPSVPDAPVPAGGPDADAAAAGGGFVYLTEGSAADEYRRVLGEIGRPLPAGRDYPPGLPEDFLPSDGFLEQGAARNQAWFTWLCAWEDEYLQADDAQDADRLAAAAEQLEWYATAPFYTQVMVDPEQGWVSNVLGPMRMGDPSGIRADSAQMCFQFPTVGEGEGIDGAQG